MNLEMLRDEYDLARRYHPDRFRKAEPALLTRLESAFARITQAYDTLRDNDLRAIGRGIDRRLDRWMIRGNVDGLSEGCPRRCDQCNDSNTNPDRDGQTSNKIHWSLLPSVRGPQCTKWSVSSKGQAGFAPCRRVP